MIFFFNKQNKQKEKVLKKELERLREKERNLDMLQKVTATIVSNLDFENITQEIVNVIATDLKYKIGVLFLINKKENYIYCHSMSEIKGAEKIQSLFSKSFREYHSSLIPHHLVSKTLYYKQIFEGKKIRDFISPDCPKHIANFAQRILRIKSVISLPAIVKKEVIGTLVFASGEEKFTKEEIEILKTFTQQAGIAINNARMYERIKRQMLELDKMTEKLATANVRLAAAYKKLQKLDRAKSEFLSIASHQLRTPLTAVKGYISMFLDGDFGKLPRKSVEPMGNVYQSNERLIKLVNSLLNVSRIEAGKMKLEKSEFSIEELISELVQEFSSQAGRKRVKLKFQKPKAKIPKIQADQNKVSQAISNLLDNALKYTHKGSITVKLAVERAKSRPVKSDKIGAKQFNRVKIIVSDTGEGMTPEELAKLFQSFSRAGAGRRFWVEGAGLGLYVAKKFIEIHQGKIWAESQGKGRGSTFYIELPIK